MMQEANQQIGGRFLRWQEGVKLWVGGVPGVCTKQDLIEFFLQFGEVVSVKVIKFRKPKTQVPEEMDPSLALVQGHAYVKMRDPEVARYLIERRELPFNEERTFSIELAVNKSEKAKYQLEKQNLRLHFSGFPASCSIERLEEHFENWFGPVTKVYRIQKHGSKQYANYGFVEVTSPETAKKILKYPCHYVEGKYLVFISKFKPPIQQDSGSSSSFKGGYPLSDQGPPQNLKVFDPYNRYKPADHANFIWRISRFSQGFESLQHYSPPGNRNQRAREGYHYMDQYSDRSDGSEEISALQSQQEDPYDPDSFKNLQETHFKGSRSSNPQIRSLQRSHPKEAMTGTHASYPGKKPGTPAFDTIENRQAYVSKAHRIEMKSEFDRKGRRLSVVEERRNKSQHTERLDPKEAKLDDSMVNYRFNILKRSEAGNPQLQPQGNQGSPANRSSSQVPEKVLIEPRNSTEFRPETLDDQPKSDRSRD